MTIEGLENLKAVLRKAIELQVNATLVMATLQSIYCDEYDELDRDTGEQLLFATDSTRKPSTKNMVQWAMALKEMDIFFDDKDKDKDKDYDEE